MAPKRKSEDDKGKTASKGAKAAKVDDKPFKKLVKDYDVDLKYGGDGDHAASKKDVVLTPTQFSTGSLGWKGTISKLIINAGEYKIPVNVTVNVTVPGSKPAKENGQKKSTAAVSDDEDDVEDSPEEVKKKPKAAPKKKGSAAKKAESSEEDKSENEELTDEEEEEKEKAKASKKKPVKKAAATK